MPGVGKAIYCIHVVKDGCHSAFVGESSWWCAIRLGETVPAMIVSVDVEALRAQKLGKASITLRMLTDTVIDLDDCARLARCR